MDERLLKSFVTTAELGSVTLAAGRLNLTQPALSRQIQRLEQQLGLPLFQRSGRALQLSLPGEKLLSHAQEFLAVSKQLRDAAAEVRRGEFGVLRVGACSQVIERYMSAILPDWTRENPNIDIRLEEGGGAELAARLAGDELHLAINARHFASSDSFHHSDVGRMGIRAYCRPDVFGPIGRTVSLAELCGQPLLLLNRRHFTREVFETACRAEGHTPRPILESGSPHTLMAMAESGQGVTVVPDLGADPQGGLVAHDIGHGGAPLYLEMSAIWSATVPLPGYGRRFIAHLRENLFLQA
ncbi:MAG TPA: LysR family transcriptional regulator [Aquamicrobium sp.]|nr:LysR family transcriptional regulator [Aquamicrobium sp.]